MHNHGYIVGPSHRLPPTAAEMTLMQDDSVLWLVIWTVNNIGVTLLNKVCFSMVDFHYPYFLSAVHMLFNSVGTQYVFWSIKRDDKRGEEGIIQKLLGRLVRKDLDRTGRRNIRSFSLVFSLNIAVGNVSLRHVSVNFNQVLRSLVPAVTIVMAMMVGKHFSVNRILSVTPIIVGVAMSCYGDMTYTALGFIYTAACVILAALKAVAAGQMLTGPHKLHPVDLLGHLAPLAMMQCIFLSIATGEVVEIVKRPELFWTDFRPIVMVVISAAFSFTLNITSLMANKLTSPLTLCIAGNVKQVLMIAISTIIFATPISPLNGTGIVVVLIGSTIYSMVSLKEKENAANKVDGENQAAILNVYQSSNNDEDLTSLLLSDETAESEVQDSSGAELQIATGSTGPILRDRTGNVLEKT